MRGHLVLKPPGGAARTPNFIPTASTIKAFMASPETVQEASEVAKKLGFKVINSSPLQVTIEGPKALFEKVFSSRLKSASPPKKGGDAVEQEGTVKQTSPDLNLYTWDKTPKLPREFEKTATQIALPQATKLHERLS